MVRSKWKETSPGSSERSTNPNIVLFVVSGELHDRRLFHTDLVDENGICLNELPDGDVFLYLGDFSQQPNDRPFSVPRQIASGEYIKNLPYKYIFAIGGNHDHLVEEAFGDQFDHPCPPTDKEGNTLPHGRERNRIDQSEAEDLVDTFQTDPAKGW